MPVIQGTKKGKAKMKGSRLQKCSAGKKYIYVHIYMYVSIYRSGETTIGMQSAVIQGPLRNASLTWRARDPCSVQCTQTSVQTRI